MNLESKTGKNTFMIKVPFITFYIKFRYWFRFNPSYLALVQNTNSFFFKQHVLFLKKTLFLKKVKPEYNILFNNLTITIDQQIIEWAQKSPFLIDWLFQQIFHHSRRCTSVCVIFFGLLFACWHASHRCSYCSNSHICSREFSLHKVNQI